MAETHPIALALGSNMGDRLAAIRAAIAELAPYVAITAVSPVYETDAAYVIDQPAFLNAALTGSVRIDALPLLHVVKNIEKSVGRLPTFRFGPRVIDIDILFHGNTVMKNPELTVPHAAMAERDFVLQPLCDIAPGWRHPVTGKRVAEMLAALPPSTMKNMGRI